MAQMLWEKAIRWYKLRHASFLAMTDFAVPWPKYLNIHLVPFSNSSYLSRRNIWWSRLNFLQIGTFPQIGFAPLLTSELCTFTLKRLYERRIFLAFF